MVINILGFWLVGLPVSLLLAFRLHAGPEGLWWGLVAGLAAVAALLVTRMVLGLRRPVARVDLDRSADGEAAAMLPELPSGSPESVVGFSTGEPAGGASVRGARPDGSEEARSR